MGWGLALGEAVGQALGTGYNVWQQQEALKRDEEKRRAELEFKRMQEEQKVLIETMKEAGLMKRTQAEIEGRKDVAAGNRASTEKIAADRILSDEAVEWLNRQSREQEGKRSRENLWKIAGLQANTSRQNAETAAAASRYGANMGASTARRGQNITRENNLFDLYSNLFGPQETAEPPSFDAWRLNFPEPATPMMTPPVSTPTAGQAAITPTATPAVNLEAEAGALLQQLNAAKQAGDYRKAQQIQIQLQQLLAKTGG